MLKVITSIFLFLAVALWAENPFVGTWNATTYGERVPEVLVITDDTIIWSDGSSQPYTFDDKEMVTKGATWLYHLKDADDIMIIGWGMVNGQIDPVLILLVRKQQQQELYLG